MSILFVDPHVVTIVVAEALDRVKHISRFVHPMIGDPFYFVLFFLFLVCAPFNCAASTLRSVAAFDFFAAMARLLTTRLMTKLRCLSRARRLSHLILKI
jgi:hypothetical protein